MAHEGHPDTVILPYGASGVHERYYVKKKLKNKEFKKFRGFCVFSGRKKFCGREMAHEGHPDTVVPPYGAGEVHERYKLKRN